MVSLTNGCVCRAERLGDDDLLERAERDPGAILPQRRPARRIGELAQPLLDRTRRRLAPASDFVEQVPFVEGEGEAGVGGDALPVDRKPALAAAAQPGELPLMQGGIEVEGENHVPQDRTAAHLGNSLEMIERRAVRLRQRELHEALVALGENLGELDARLVVHDVGDHRRPVAVALHLGAAARLETLRRPAACARVHRLVQQPAHLGVLGLGRHHAGLGPLDAEHPHQQRSERHERTQIDRLRQTIESVEKFREGHPVPRQPRLHRVVRNRLDARHRTHRALAIGRTNGRKAEAAVADDHRGHPVPAGQGAVRIPEHLRVVVRVEIDEARGDDHAAGIEHARAIGRPDVSQLGDATVLDGDIAPAPRHARAVDHHAAPDHRVVERHLVPHSVAIRGFDLSHSDVLPSMSIVDAPAGSSSTGQTDPATRNLTMRKSDTARPVNSSEVEAGVSPAAPPAGGAHARPGAPAAGTAASTSEMNPYRRGGPITPALEDAVFAGLQWTACASVAFS